MTITLMNNLYFLRHCRTENNIERVITGQMDIPILGNEEVEVNQYENQKSLLLLCSPLMRCKETANIFIQTTKIVPEIKFCDGLLERGMGDLEGLERRKAVSKYPDYFVNDKFIYSMTPPNGESYLHFSERADEFINNTLVESMKIGNVILCSHNQILKMIYFKIKGIPIEEFWYKTGFINGKIYKIL